MNRTVIERHLVSGPLGLEEVSHRRLLGCTREGVSAEDGEEGLSAGDDLEGGWEMPIVTLRF